MKKSVIIILVLLLAVNVFAALDRDVLSRYAGKNAEDLMEMLDTAEADTLQYMNFLLENCAATDLAILTPEYIKENIRYALKARELPYAESYDEEIFRHFVLPHRMSQEPLENWRKTYYEELMPLVKDAETIAEAAILINIWCLEEMTYKPTHGRDQSAFTSSKRGYGRCEEMMIIYMCAARAVGIPVRSCSAPYWNFTDSNHAWIEVWTPTGWKYLGEPASSLSRTWFTNTTQRATLVTAKAFGNYDHPAVIKQENNVTTLSSIEYYTDSYLCSIKVVDEQNMPVAGATVSPMAVSFGGIWGMTDLTTDEAGNCQLPLGMGSTLLIAGKDEQCGWKMLNNLSVEDRELTIQISDDTTIDEDFSFLFPLPGSNPRSNEEPEYFGDKFALMRENASLKHAKRLNNQKHTAEFARYYDQIFLKGEADDEYYEKREEFLSKADELGANADDFLHIFTIADEDESWVTAKMITTWDIKDLCEIPDSLALGNIVDIYAGNRYRYSTGDSLFAKNCIARTWRSASPPQNGWQKEFYELAAPYLQEDISSTVTSLIQWIDENTEVEEEFTYTYYSTSLNPLQMLNMYHIPAFYRVKLLNSALKYAGIAVRWEGRLEYYDGKSWIAAPVEEDKDEAPSRLMNFVLQIYVDGKEVKAEPYDNFLVASLTENGSLYPTWFDGENDSLSYVGKYRLEDGETIHLEAVVRNGNGDALVALRSLTEDGQQIVLDITTPKEFLDFSTQWQPETIAKLNKIIDKSMDADKNKIVMVRGKNSSEPQIHTLRFIKEKLTEFAKHNAQLLIYSENRSISDLKDDEQLNDAVLLKGKALLADELAAENYPALFVFDKDNELIFSTWGYNMGIADLLIKKLKTDN